MIVLYVPGFQERFADLSSGAQAVSATATANSLEWRLDYWPSILSLADGNYVTGIGLDTTQLVEQSGLAPHNVPIQTYVEMGYIGTAALLLVIAAFVVTSRRRRRSSVTSTERVFALATIGIGIMIAVEALSSNVFTQTMVYWYVAGAVAYGFGPAWPWSDPTSESRPEASSPFPHGIPVADVAASEPKRAFL